MKSEFMEGGYPVDRCYYCNCKADSFCGGPEINMSIGV
jgi:hypothetical protein